MVSEGFPGSRLLSLRRRRSRLPWIYLVYQEGSRSTAGARERVRAAEGSSYPLPLETVAVESTPRAGERPAHRTPRGRRDRRHPHPSTPDATLPLPPKAWQPPDRAKAVWQSTCGRDPAPAIPCDLSDAPYSDAARPASGSETEQPVDRPQSGNRLR